MARRTSKKSSSRSSGSDGNSVKWWLALVLLILIPVALIWKNRSSQTSQPVPAKTNAPSVKVPVLSAPSSSNITVSTAVPAKPITPTPSPADVFPRPTKDLLEAQIALARLAISSGSIDGSKGTQTRAAFTAFQIENNLPTTGEFDSATQAKLLLQSAPFTSYTVTRDDLSRLQPIRKTWLGKSEQSALAYETLLELVSELGHASPNLIRKLNPKVNWTNFTAGTAITIPNVEYPQPKAKAAFIFISLSRKQLEVFDANNNLLAHFPCSIAARVDKRPIGELHITKAVPNPDYTFNPEVFPESAEARSLGRKLILPPGPNNPVGTAWMSLDKPGYGIHGTPSPEQVGRTESHGCFRLANWNATYLLKLAWIGLPVRVLP